MMPNETDILRAISKEQAARIESLKTEIATLNTANTNLVKERDTLKRFIIREHPELTSQKHGIQPEPFPQEFDTEEVVSLLLKSVRDGQGQTVGQLAKSIGMNTQQTSLLLQMLKKQGVVRSEGARRATRYYIA